MGRLFAGLLSFIVGVQFTVGQIPFSLNEAQAQTSCPSGQQFDSIMGRCLSTAQASQVAQATSSCSSITDTAEKRKCYLSNAEAALASAEAEGTVKGEGKVSSDMMSMILSLGGIFAGVSFIAAPKCGPMTTSGYIMAAASAAAFMGEILSAETYKKKMKDANETLKKINEGSAGTTKSGSSSDVMNATNVQEEAFNALIKKEEAVIAAANTKKKLYTLAMAGYAAGMVMAGIELVKAMLPGGRAATTCYASVAPAKGDLTLQYVDNYFQKNQRVPFTAYLKNTTIAQAQDWSSLQMSILEMQLMREGYSQSPAAELMPKQEHALAKEDFSLIKSFTIIADNIFLAKAHALPIVGLGALGVTAAVALKVKGVAAATSKLFKTPETRLGLSTLLTANAVMTKNKASKEAGKAKDRKAFLEKLREQVIVAGNGVNCASADAAQASAACKTTNSELINPNNASSNPGLVSGQFDVVDPNDPILGKPKCITNTGAYDAACSCKSNNTCLSIGSSISGSVPSGVSLGSVPSTLDSITGGSLAGASLDEASLNSQAARLNQLNANLAKKNPAIAKGNKDAQKMADDLTASLSSQMGGASLASSGSGSDSLLNAKTPEQALEQMKSEIKQEIGKVEGQGSTASAPSSDLDLSGLGSEEEKPAALEANDKLAEVMASDYEMGNNDINTDSTAGLFDIVSNRMKRSGLRRLFGSENVIPVDKAAPSDINR